MYRTIYVPVDNSDYSNAAIDLALTFGKAFRASLVGSHVYAAKLHDVRFKQMEFTLPDEYKEDDELEKQRRIHDALIGRGLHLISDSYLDQMDVRAKEAQLSFERKHFDGKNFEAIVKDVNDCLYDLVVLGALGQGAVKDSLVGSVVERLLRRTEVDTLVVREIGEVAGDAEADEVTVAPTGSSIAVCLDGSAHSYAGLVTACKLALSFGKQVEILAAADPATDEAPLLRAHLQVAERYATAQGVKASSRLLEGAGRDALTRLLAERHEQKESPWLLVVGRCGIDAAAATAVGDAPIGSTTEHLVRHAPCNVLVSGRTTAPTELFTPTLR
jgi:nucleotide-binding universal stress UspA family protein